MSELVRYPEGWVGCQDCDVSFNCYDGEQKCIRLSNTACRHPTFIGGSTVEHVKSKKRYIILVVPAACRIEATNKPSYVYKAIDDIIMWVRPQDEMEDGRFKLIME